MGFTIMLYVAPGMATEEMKRRLHAALFILNGIKKLTGVTVALGPKLERLLENPETF